MKFEPVIGLEIHAQLKTRTKIFCGCSTEFGAPPNTHTCPVCLGMPGVLPVLNKKVVDFTLRMALAVDCDIKRYSRFARKNYFYPDLPKGYQISQYELPVAVNGHIIIEVNQKKMRIGITRIHMEEDAGKLTHDPARPVSMVDFNRTGVPLIEIVSEPDLRSPAEAGVYLRHLRSIVRCLEICDGNMEQGSFRCDANISLRPEGTENFGTRAELKNLNSFKHVEKALRYEINRQKDILTDNGSIVQETRLWDPVKNRTFSMRGKEDAHDYRYFPDPDLLPIVIDDPWVMTVKSNLPELPEAKKDRFVQTYELPVEEAGYLAADRDLSDYFEACVKLFPKPRMVCHWMMGPLLGMLKSHGKNIAETPVSHQDVAELLNLVDQKVISQKIAKIVFEEMALTGKPANTIIKEKGLVQIQDTTTLETIIKKVLSENKREVEDYLNGKTKLIGFFVGQIMTRTKGRADPRLVNKILKNIIDINKNNK